MYQMIYDQENLPEVIRRSLQNREPRQIHDAPSHYKHAGVLIGLMKEEGIHKVLFTKRTDRVEHHKGQISFPGGAADEEDDSIEETVLRESCEEIGACEEVVDLLGRIDDALTLESGFIVHPFVGLFPSRYEFSISRSEVKRLIKVPWNVLVECHKEKKTYLMEDGGGTKYKTPAFEFNGDVIWGATARMMENFIDILARK